MSDIHIRTTGAVGRITLNRPAALNALTCDMVRAIDTALIGWATRDDIAMLLIDAAGDKAFCSGGDIQQMYATGRAGDYGYGRRFWRDEYAMNARLFNFPKPVASFLKGYTMGGGVGLGCHASHRIVGHTSRIAMPECGIGLVPDVGGSLILARAPGRLGEYLGTTAARMDAADAIHAGFADYFIPEDDWPALIAALESTADRTLIDSAAQDEGDSSLSHQTTEINYFFSAETLFHLHNALSHSTTDFAHGARGALERVSPLSTACTLELIRRARGLDTIEHALGMEYRFTHRAMEHGDFLEGIRAALIDKDRTPHWRHTLRNVGAHHAAMLRPLGNDALDLGKTT